MTKKEKSELYDILYNAGKALFAHHNPCKIISGICIQKDNCCNDCKYLGNLGCTVKALDCKLWVCPMDKDLILKDRLAYLRRVQYKYLPSRLRGSKKDVLGF